MKEKTDTGARLLQTLTDVYLALMLSVYLLWPGFGGYETITEAKFRLFLVLSLAWCGLMLLLALELRLTQPRGGKQKTGGAFALRPCEWLLLGYLLCSLIAALASPWRADTWLGLGRHEGLLMLTVYVLIFLLIGRFARPAVWMLDVFGASMSLNCLLAAVQMFGKNPFGLYPAGVTYFDAGTAYTGVYLGTVGNADLLAAVLCVAAPAFFYGAWKLRRRWLIAPLALCVYVAVRMDVSAGLLGIAAGVLLPLPLALPKKYCRIAAAALGAALLALAVCVAVVPGLPGIFGEAHALLHGEADDSFGSGRVFIWRSVWQAVKERPLFGGGPDTLSRRVTAYFERYDAAQGLVIRSGIDAAHNEYLNILANQGVFALLCWLGALGCSAVRFVRRGAESSAVLLCGGAVLGYCVQAFFGISMCLTTPYFLIAWAILENRRKEEQNR